MTCFKTFVKCSGRRVICRPGVFTTADLLGNDYFSASRGVVKDGGAALWLLGHGFQIAGAIRLVRLPDSLLKC